jgi:hypothetical protein
MLYGLRSRIAHGDDVVPEKLLREADKLSRLDHGLMPNRRCTLPRTGSVTSSAGRSSPGW